MRRCAKACPCSSNSRRSSASSPTSASGERSGLMGRPPDARLTPERRARGLRADRRRSSAGRVDRRARERNTSSGCAPATAAPATSSTRSRSQAARKEDVLKALSQIAKTFRTRVGESLATVEKHSTAARGGDDGVARGAQGVQRRIEGQRHRRITPRRFRCSSVRPNSIRNSRWRSCVWDVCTAVSARQRSPPKAPTRAYELRHRASDPRTLLHLRRMYDRQVTGNLESQLQTLTLWAQTYPPRLPRTRATDWIRHARNWTV